MHTRLFFAAFVLSASGGLADDPTKPDTEHDQLVEMADAPERTNDVFPLSDQANKQGWILRQDLSDEFDGDGLDLERWKLGARKWQGRPPTLFDGSNVSVDRGELIFRINQHSERLQLPQGYTHTSGFIHSRQRVLYGYFEAELRLMDAPWVSGFWMAYGDKDWWTEIDVCENCPWKEERARDLNSNVHVFRSPAEHGGVKSHIGSSRRYKVPYDLRDDYHVWGLSWTEESIGFFIDGVLFREVENTYWHQPLVINLNTESNKWFDALPSGEEGETDQAYRVKYLRVWQ